MGTCSPSKTDNSKYEINDLNFLTSEFKILMLSGLREDEIE